MNANMSNTLQPGAEYLSSNFPLHRACRDGDVQTVGLILESNINMVTVEDCSHNWNPSHWAAYFGRIDCLRHVATVVPSIINSQSSKTFQTPLHCAAEAGDPHCVLWLLQAGANPDVKDKFGEIALHKASRSGNTECVSLLVTATKNISSMNNHGHTASISAEICGHSAIAEFIRKSEQSGVNRYWGIQDAYHPNLLRSTLYSSIEKSRKRSHDAMDDNSTKRIRMEAHILPKAPPTINGIFNFAMCPLTNVTSSVLEHEKLCRMEHGYTNSLLESMINEFHGC